MFYRQNGWCYNQISKDILFQKAKGDPMKVSSKHLYQVVKSEGFAIPMPILLIPTRPGPTLP